MKRIWIILLFAVVSVCKGQNLVPNPSFEQYDTCPVNGLIHYCKYWINCGNTPDYDNSCAGSGYNFGVPENVIGYQYSATGNAYCDLWTYSITGFYREYIGVTLIHPVTIGHTYHVSFKCSPGTLNGYSLQTNKLGIRFSTIAYDSVHTAPTDNFAHFYTDSIVRDTANWTTIGGDFTADSAYSFLTIGNFFDDAHTDTASVKHLSFFGVYYIDDVNVSDTITGLNEMNIKNEEIKVRYQQNSLEFISENTITRIEILNSLGQQCIKFLNPNNSNVLINTEGLSKGIYLAYIQTCHSSSQIIKLLIN